MKNKFIKISGSVLLVIFLGAIGSGLWERFLSPVIDKLIEVTINGMSCIVSSYRDSIYVTAAEGFHESSAVSLYTVALAILPFLYLTMLLFHRQVG